MRKVINLPVDKCPLDVLANMGEEIRGAKILLNLSAFKKLTKTADKYEKVSESHVLFWEATEKFPETTVMVETEYINDNDYTGYVYHIVYINATDICFRTQWDDCPNEYLFVLEESL